MAFEAQNAENNLILCLRPIVLWMKAIGIHLPNNCDRESSFRNKITNIICNLHSYGLCLANIALNTAYIIHFVCKRNIPVNQTSRTETSTTSWNTLIDDINYIVHSISVHIITFFVVSSWKQIIDSLMMTENFNFLQKSFRLNYTKLSKLCAAAVFYIIISVRYFLAPYVVI